MTTSGSLNVALVGITAPHSGAWLETLQNLEEVGRLVVCDVDGGGDGDGDDARMLPVEVVGGDPMDWTTVTIHLDDLSICSEVGTDPDYVASLVAALRAC